ncbi:D-alanine--D-alanine ligase family protein [Pelolinea submarina]|uniref:D-alanine--D-alanine ligase n=1 Tax=Pelolinea submarina TaxID=913107 RepID=A0A3E0AHB7_9CHLR|nr:ATP-grasp domain-containing protein [Pelolinea submarina]REG11011.1 D-alanine--D-alanine ligase [Pelolinea submarina]
MHLVLVYDSNNPRQDAEGSRVIQSFHEDVNQAIIAALQANGHVVSALEADANLEERLRELKPDFVFNCSNTGQDEGEKSYAPRILNKLGIPFTGSGGSACYNAYDKERTKRILLAAHIATPQALVIHNPHHYKIPETLTYPLFVKPVSGGCSYGIGRNNLIRSQANLNKRIQQIYDQVESPLLVEEFLEGREFTAGILGNNQPLVLPLMEFKYKRDNGASFRSYQLKMVDYADEEVRCPAELGPNKLLEVRRLVQRTYKAIGCRDYARVDVRMDRTGKPYVLEVNALPNLMPKTSSYAIMAQKAGMNFCELIRSILRTAAARYSTV